MAKHWRMSLKSLKAWSLTEATSLLISSPQAKVRLINNRGWPWRDWKCIAVHCSATEYIICWQNRINIMHDKRTRKTIAKSNCTSLWATRWSEWEYFASPREKGTCFMHTPCQKAPLKPSCVNLSIQHIRHCVLGSAQASLPTANRVFCWCGHCSCSILWFVLHSNNCLLLVFSPQIHYLE